MGYTIAFHTGGLKDYDEACSWYWDKNPETETLFKKAIDQRLQDVVKNPEAYGIRFKSIRAINVKKFPYLIYYEIDFRFKYIYVLAVWHEARDQNALKRRV